MRQKIVLALLLTCGIFLVGCSDDDSGGSGLSCDSSYSAPVSLEGGEVSAVISGGGGELCGIAGGNALIEFGPGGGLASDEMRITSSSPCPSDVEWYFYNYSTSGALGDLSLYLYFDKDPEDYVGDMQFCQTSETGGNYRIDAVDGSWQAGTFEFTD